MLEPVVRLQSIIAPKFYGVHNAIKSGKYSEIWLKGGRSSTKSSFIAIEIIKGMMEDPDANAIVFRKVGDTIRNSVHQLFLWAIGKLEAEDHFDWTTSPAEIIYKKTNQKVIFKGLDKPEKLKSIALQSGYFKYSWLEETAEYSGAEEVRNVLQSVVRGGKTHLTFYSYNPPDDEYNWVNKEAEYKVPGRYVHHSTYLDVPADWLGEKFIEKAELLKARNYDRYRHEYLGEVVGRTEKLVMAGRWRVATETDFKRLDFDTLDGPYMGADWGFSKDPNVLSKIWIDWEVNASYVEYAQYGYKTEIDDLPELFAMVPGSSDNPVRADSARPETISYLKRNNYPKMRGVSKWAGSVEEGVNFMKQFTWIFHPRCTEAIEEAKNWSYKTNRGGDVLSKLDDGYDHFWDSARYALSPLIRKREIEDDVVDPSSTGGGFFTSAIVM
jgi:PBSX family phage terminase large subunit